MEEIKNCYKLMIENIPQFQEFLKQENNLSIEELVLKYNININKEQEC